MGNSTTKILYFHCGKPNITGWYGIHFVVLRNKKILCYATYCRDFENMDVLSSTCREEQRNAIVDTLKYIFLVRKVKYSRFIFTASYKYAGKKYRARTSQIYTGGRFCQSDIIWKQCPRTHIPIGKVPLSF